MAKVTYRKPKCTHAALEVVKCMTPETGFKYMNCGDKPTAEQMDLYHRASVFAARHVDRVIKESQKLSLRDGEFRRHMALKEAVVLRDGYIMREAGSLNAKA